MALIVRSTVPSRDDLALLVGARRGPARRRRRRTSSPKMRGGDLVREVDLEALDVAGRRVAAGEAERVLVDADRDPSALAELGHRSRSRVAGAGAARRAQARRRPRTPAALRRSWSSSSPSAAVVVGGRGALGQRVEAVRGRRTAGDRRTRRARRRSVTAAATSDGLPLHRYSRDRSCSADDDRSGSAASDDDERRQREPRGSRAGHRRRSTRASLGARASISPSSASSTAVAASAWSITATSTASLRSRRSSSRRADLARGRRGSVVASRDRADRDAAGVDRAPRRRSGEQPRLPSGRPMLAVTLRRSRPGTAPRCPAR